MKNAITMIAAATVSAAVVLSAPAVAGSGHDKGHKKGHETHWGYGGAGGPQNWAALKSEYSACAGNQQSPINIQSSAASKADLTNIDINWNDTVLSILNNGHTIQANYDGGSSIKVNDKEFDLLQFHFHAPSEHAYNGKLYDMEAHFVHKADNGELAVVGVFFEEGADNKALKPVWENMPHDANKTNTVANININGSDLLPDNTNKYFHYMGSLTTPPCSEVVNWYVMEQPIQASKSQISAFSELVHENNRPVQPLNRRFVLGSE